MSKEVSTWDKAAKLNPLLWTGHYPVDLKKIKVESLTIALKLNFSAIDLLLDLGCGIGLHSIFWSKKVREQILLDISNEMLKKTKNILRHLQAKIHLINCDVRYLPIRSESVDKIVCLGVLKHLDRNPLSTFQALKEAERVLKVSGKLYVNDLVLWPHFNSILEKVVVFVARCFKYFTPGSYYYRKVDVETIMKILYKGSVSLRSYGWKLIMSDIIFRFLPKFLRYRVEKMLRDEGGRINIHKIPFSIYSHLELLYEKRS
jgi:ubiquinone/menaquinone biosynthesis C-methylase UbiE